MNWGNLGWILYYAAHTAAGIWSLLELFLLEAVQELGLAAWAFGVLWLALAAAGRTGCPSLQGTVWRIFTAGLLPALCGAVDALWRGDMITPTPAMWAFFLPQLLLAGCVLLPGRVEGPGWKQGLALLERGWELNLFLMLWLFLLAGSVLFMSTGGLLFSFFIGVLLAGSRRFLDYDGVAGIVTGLGLLWLLRRYMLLRAWRLAAEEDQPGPWFALLVPVWGLVQAGRLEKSLRARQWAAEGYDRF